MTSRNEISEAVTLAVMAIMMVGGEQSP